MGLGSSGTAWEFQARLSSPRGPTCIFENSTTARSTRDESVDAFCSLPPQMTHFGIDKGDQYTNVIFDNRRERRTAVPFFSLDAAATQRAWHEAHPAPRPPAGSMAQLCNGMQSPVMMTMSGQHDRHPTLMACRPPAHLAGEPGRATRPAAGTPRRRGAAPSPTPSSFLRSSCSFPNQRLLAPPSGHHPGPPAPQPPTTSHPSSSGPLTRVG